MNRVRKEIFFLIIDTLS